MPRRSNDSSTSPRPLRAAIATADLPSSLNVGSAPCVEQQLDNREGVVARDGVMEGTPAARSHPIGSAPCSSRNFTPS